MQLVKQLKWVLATIAMVAISSSLSWAEVVNGSAYIDGTATGTVTGLNYGADGSLETVEFTTNDGTELEVNNENTPDVDEFGGPLTNAFNHDFEVVLEVEGGDLVSVKLKRKPKKKPGEREVDEAEPADESHTQGIED